MRPEDLFPHATTDPSGITKMKKWLAQEQADLEDYKANKGKSGYYFGRGFSGDTKRTIARIKKWLSLIH